MKLLQNSFTSKLIGALLGTIIGSVILTIMFMVTGPKLGSIGLFPFILLVTGGYMFALGLPVSLVSYFITLRLSGWVRRLVSALIHVGSAVGFIWFSASNHQRFFLLFCAILFSTVYWLIDEWLRFKYQKPSVEISEESK